MGCFPSAPFRQLPVGPFDYGTIGPRPLLDQGRALMSKAGGAQTQVLRPVAFREKPAIREMLGSGQPH